LSRFANNILKSKEQEGAEITRKATGGIVMSAPKIASLLAIAGLLGVLASVILGKLPGADYVLDAAFVCFGLAAIVVISHVLTGLWTDFTTSA
jgi:hypothetical protein